MYTQCHARPGHAYRTVLRRRQPENSTGVAIQRTDEGYGQNARRCHHAPLLKPVRSTMCRLFLSRCGAKTTRL